MKHQKPSVFLSSTSDLATERAAVFEALGPMYDVYLYEQHHAGRAPPEEVVRERILEADVFIAVLGPTYGTPFATAPTPKSIVEWEFDTACGRESLEIFTFVQRPPSGSVVDPRQQVFLDRVTSFRNGMWCKFFASGNDLVIIVRDALTQWLLGCWSRVQDSKRALAQWLHSILVVITTLVVGSVVVVNVPPVRESFTTSSRLAFCAVGVLVVVLSIVLLRTELGGRND